MHHKNPAIVTANWLVERLNDSSISIVDASWYLPKAQRDPIAEYRQSHIPGAVFFNLDEVRDLSSNLANTIPKPDYFAKKVGELGITNDKIIVVYDGPGFFSAPRVWWMLRVMGAKNVVILDGGFDQWRNNGFPVSHIEPIISRQNFYPAYQKDRVVSFSQMKAHIEKRDIQVVDARGRGRFRGEEKEPRVNMRSGHMPGAKNVPASSLSDQGYFKSQTSLAQIFSDAGVDINAPTVASCGSGITACCVLFALESLGNKEVYLYDGSWSEWGAHKDTQVVTGD